MKETIKVEKKANLAQVLLMERTMRPVFFEELGNTFRSLSQDGDLRAITLSSATQEFSFGLDLRAAASEMGELFAGGGAATRMKLLEHIEVLQERFEAVRNCPVPTIAAIQGRCLGGGVDLVAACDIRLAAKSAVFSVRETKIGIVADLGSLQRLPDIIGQGMTRELAFTGRNVGAEEALRIGLVNHLYENSDALQAAAQEMAQEIADNAPLTVKGVKKVLNFGQGRRQQDGFDYVAAWNAAFLASEDLGEAMAAFMEKRKPQFKGR